MLVLSAFGMMIGMLLGFILAYSVTGLARYFFPRANPLVFRFAWLIVFLAFPIHLLVEILRARS